MARRKRIQWEHGDLFAVPLVDGSFGIVQAIDHWMPHWIYTAITDRRVDAVPPSATPHAPGGVISLIAVSDDAFDFGAFTRIGPAAALARRKDFPNERFAQSGYVGAKSYTGGIVGDFLSAWHGLSPWTQYKDPEYFDKLLVNGVRRPSRAASGGG